MVQQLSQLRVDAAMEGDAQFVAKSQAMARSLDQLTAAAIGAGNSTTQSDTRIVNTTNAYDRMRLRVDAVARAERDLDNVRKASQRALDAGKATQDGVNRTLAAYEDRLLRARQASDDYAGAVERAKAAQASFNTVLGVRDTFGGPARAADMAAYGQELDRVRAKYVPLAAAQQGYIAQLNEIRQSVKAGALTQAEGATAITRTKESFVEQVKGIKEATGAAKAHTGAVKLQGYQIANLGQQVQDVGVQLAMGTNPFLIMAQQGPQITTAMGGVRNSMELVKPYFNMWTIGGAAVAGTMALIINRAVSLESEARSAGIAIRAMGRDAELSTAQFHGMVREMQTLGIARKDAQAAITGAIYVPNASNDNIAQAVHLAPDFAVAYRQSIDQATKSLAEMGAKGYSAIKKLDEAYNFLSPSQMEMIRQLTLAGDKAGAVAIAMGALQSQIGGMARDAMGPLAQASADMKESWNDMLDSVASSGSALATLHAFQAVFTGIASAVRELGDMRMPDVLVGLSGLPGIGPILQALGYITRGFDDMRPAPEGVMGGPGQAHGAPKRVGTAPIGGMTDIERKQIDEATDALERQTAAYHANAGVRQIVQARIEAETAALLDDKSAAFAKAQGDIAAAKATAQMSAAANDNLVSVRAQAQATLQVASAYGVSTAAGLEAQAAMQARMAKLQNATVDEQALTKALLDQARANQALAASQELTSQKLNTDIAAAKARAAAIVDPNARHQAELQIARQERLNQLQVQYSLELGKIPGLMAEFDSQQAYNDQARYLNDVRDMALSVSGDISQFLMDGFTNVERGGGSVFKNLWDGALAGGKRFLANIAAEFLKQKLILPFVMEFVGGNSGLLGIVQAAGGGTGGAALGAGGSGGGGLMNMLSNVGSGLSSMMNGGLSSSFMADVGSWIAKGQLGQALGMSAPVTYSLPAGVSGPVGTGMGMTGLGSSFSSALGNTPYGMIGSIAASLMGFKGSGNMAIDTGFGLAGSIGGSMLMTSAVSGTALGATLGSAAGPIGAAIGALIGTIASGFFAKKPSDNFALSPIDVASGKVGSAVYNPKESDQGNIDGSQKMSDTFLQIAQAIAATTGGKGPTDAFVKVGSRDGIVVGVGDGADFWTANYGGQAGVATGTFNDAEAALNFMVKSFVTKMTGVVDADYNRIIAMDVPAQTMLDNLNVAAQVKSLSQTKDISAASDQLKELLQQFSDLEQKARALGLATGDLVKAETNQLRALDQSLRVGFAAKVQQYIGQFLTPLQQLQDAISVSGDTTYDKFLAAQSLFRDVAAKAAQGNEVALAMLAQAGQTYADLARNLSSSTGPLREFLDSLNSGSLSNLTPSQQLSAAQDKFQSLSARAASGDTSVISELQAAGQTYLTIAREYGASGQVYQDAYSLVTGSINALITQIDGMISTVDSTGVLTEISTAIGPLIGELKASQESILAGIQPTLDDMTSSFRLQIDTLKDEGVQTRALLAQIASGILGVPVGVAADPTKTPASGPLQQHAQGGLIVGPGTGTSDSVLLRGSNGEYVMQASSVQRFGVGFFDRLNAGHVPVAAGPSNDNRAVVDAIYRVGAETAQQIAELTQAVRELKAENAELKLEIRRADRRTSVRTGT